MLAGVHPFEGRTEAGNGRLRIRRHRASDVVFAAGNGARNERLQNGTSRLTPRDPRRSRSSDAAVGVAIMYPPVMPQPAAFVRS